MQSLEPDVPYLHPGQQHVFSFTFTSKHLPVPDHALRLHQVHGAHVLAVDPAHHGKMADAWLFPQPRQEMAAILVADCLPVALHAPTLGKAALAHCGHRGLSGQLLAETVATMRPEKAPVFAWLGPCIGPCCYQVQSDVADHFKPWAAALSPHPQRGYWLDLKQVAMLQLASLGVEVLGIVPHCTHCQPDLYHSFRREHAGRGRQSLLGTMKAQSHA